MNSAGGAVIVSLDHGASYNPTPMYAGYQNRNLPLTEEIEVSGDTSFSFAIAADVTDLAAGVSFFEVY